MPTEEELHTLRRVSGKIPWLVLTIAFVELVERMSYYGTIAVFTNFIQKPNPGTATGRPLDPNDKEAQPGALGMGQQASTGISNFNKFWVYLMPLLGAYIADTYLGRFKTIVYACIIAEVGHIILTVSAVPGVMARPHTSLGVFILGLIFMGVGTGFFKPNISPLIAEQVPQEVMHVKTTEKGERVIVDPAITTSRIYNYFYLFINIGALVGQVGMVYAERYVGFYLSFLIPTLFFLLCFPVLLFCRTRYIRHKPEGNVLLPAVKLLFLGLKGRWHLNPVRMWRHWHDGTFWECIKPSYFGSTRPSWMDFDDAWVDEVARGWSACSVFLWYPLYWITYNQIENNLTSQASTMKLGGVPNDIISNLNPFAIMILIPLMDTVVYPALRRAGVRFTPIKRITFGFFLGTAAMVYACVLQFYMSVTLGSPCLDCKSPLTIWLQTPIYILIAASEILASITSLEYAFTKAPKNMRSLVQAFALFMSAISAALGFALVALSRNPLLVWNYGTAAVASFLGGCAFWWCCRGLDEVEDRLNMLPRGRMGVTEEMEMEVRGRK
ncbi:MFS peptide transporter-like protein Ptr2, partial [Westerdykella ornata]